MAETTSEEPGKHKLIFFDEGIVGRRLTLLSRFVERRKARKEASRAVHGKNEILKDANLFFELTKTHKISPARAALVRTLQTLLDIFQETTDVAIDECFVAQEVLIDLGEFAKAHGNELSDDELVALERYLDGIEGVLKDVNHYINDLSRTMEGGGSFVGLLHQAKDRYVVSGVLSPFRPLVEWFQMRSETKGTFRLEAHIQKLESKKKVMKGDILGILRDDKRYVQEFRDVMTKMFVYALIAIQNGLRVRNEAADAISEKRLDLPYSFKVFVTYFEKYFAEEHRALKSVEKSISHLEELVSNARAALRDARKRRAQTPALK